MLCSVTFDCWGTLVDLKHTNAAQRIDYLCAHLSGYTPERVAQAYQDSWSLFGQDNPHLEGIPLADLVLNQITDLPGTLDNLYGGIS